jgi:hypothetical protein
MNLIDDLKIDIKSLLLSSKDGMTEGELKSEYFELTGNDLTRKIHDIGFKNVHDFMNLSPDSFNIRKHHNGIIWVYHAKSDENTLDLFCLIKGQKDTNKGKREEKRSKEANRRKKMQEQPNSRPNRFRSQNGDKRYEKNRVRFNFSNENNHYNNFRNRSPSLTYYDKNKTNVFSNNNGFSNNNSMNSNNNNKRIFGYPSIIKNRVEAVLLEATDHKLQINRFEKEYEKKHGALLDYKAYGYDSIIDMIESMKDIVSLDLSYNQSSFFDTYTLRLLRPKSLTDSDYCSNNSLNRLTDLNSNLNLNDVHDLNDDAVVKCKKIQINNQNVNLISINGAIIVHWTQIADLFSIKQVIFKKLLDLIKIDVFTKKFKYNDNNRFLFDMIEDRLDINLEETNELNEICFIYYNKLFDLCELVFSNDLNKSSQLKIMIKQASHDNKIFS